jgi:hypothetical protein
MTFALCAPLIVAPVEARFRRSGERPTLSPQPQEDDMKYATALLIAFEFAALAQPASAKSSWDQLAEMAPRMERPFDQEMTAPRADVFTELDKTAPRTGVLDDVSKTAP